LTSDIATRLTAHNAGRVPSTERHGSRELLAVVAFQDDAVAVRFEKYLKSGSGQAFARRHFV
jgi:putative endonuclease